MTGPERTRLFGQKPNHAGTYDKERTSPIQVVIKHWINEFAESDERQPLTRKKTVESRSELVEMIDASLVPGVETFGSNICHFLMLMPQGVLLRFQSSVEYFFFSTRAVSISF